MNKQLNKIIGFTLIEVVVSITIFSIVMVSVIMIFSSASGVSQKIDLSRAMQENMKNIVETIGKDINDYKVSGVSLQKAASDCNLNNNSGRYRVGDKLCLGGMGVGYEYYLAKYIDATGTWSRIDSTEISTRCSGITDECVLVRYDKLNGETTRLSNSMIYFRDLSFSTSNDYVPKVVVNFTIQPSFKAGVKSKYIEESKMTFQTTFSQRLLDTN